MITVLVSPEELAGDEARIEGEAYRHLFRSRRLTVGDAVRVVDGEGRARRGAVAAVDRSTGLLSLGDPAPSLEAELRLDLWVATPRPQRASWLVEKATEVGVHAVRFVSCARAARQLAPGQRRRLERVAAAAVEQCGRARRPEVSGPHPWPELQRRMAGYGLRHHLDLVKSASPASSPALSTAPATTAALLVGPEGGWTDQERGHLEAAGSVALGLGQRVLRLETAAIVGAAALLLR